MGSLRCFYPGRAVELVYNHIRPIGDKHRYFCLVKRTSQTVDSYFKYAGSSSTTHLTLHIILVVVVIGRVHLFLGHLRLSSGVITLNPLPAADPKLIKYSSICGGGGRV